MCCPLACCVCVWTGESRLFLSSFLLLSLKNVIFVINYGVDYTPMCMDFNVLRKNITKDRCG